MVHCLPSLLSKSKPANQETIKTAD